MADDRLRVGVIGANADRSWAANSHLPALQKLPDFELAAVCTTREESARESAERFGARLAFHDYREMLDRDDIDAVAVSVRVPRHYEPTMAALEAGKHVYTEWPLGANLDEAKEMASFARAKGVKTMVGLQERRAPLYLSLKELVDEGYFGELLSCMVVWSGSGILDRSSDQRWRADDRVRGEHADHRIRPHRRPGLPGPGRLHRGVGHIASAGAPMGRVRHRRAGRRDRPGHGDDVRDDQQRRRGIRGVARSAVARQRVPTGDLRPKGHRHHLHFRERRPRGAASDGRRARRRARRGAHTRTAVAGARVGDAERRLLHRPDVEALRCRDPGGPASRAGLRPRGRPASPSGRDRAGLQTGKRQAV